MPRDSHLDEMGDELSGAFGAASIGRTRALPGTGNSNQTPKEPKAKKAKTETQEAQSVLWLAFVPEHVLQQVNNTANKYLTESQLLLNELNIASDQTVCLGRFDQACLHVLGRSAHFKTALLTDLNNGISELTGVKDALVKSMANKIDIKSGVDATCHPFCDGSSRKAVQATLKTHKKTMDTIKSHLKPPNEGKARGGKAKAKAKAKAAA